MSASVCAEHRGECDLLFSYYIAGFETLLVEKVTLYLWKYTAQTTTSQHVAI